VAYKSKVAFKHELLPQSAKAEWEFKKVLPTFESWGIMNTYIVLNLKSIVYSISVS